MTQSDVTYSTVYSTAPKKHVGFTEEVTSKTIWTDYSHISAVSESEKRRFRHWNIIVSFSWIIFVLLSLIGYFVCSRVENVLTLEQIKTIRSISGFLGGIGLFILFFSGHILKLICIRVMRSRPDQLFYPDWGCVYVEIENASSFDKMKFTAEDFGLLKIYPGLLQLEMTGHRAQFSTEDISIEIVSYSTNSIGVNLTCNLEPHAWSVTLVAASQSWNLAIGASHKAKALWLMKKIETLGNLKNR